jgi:hypothetical protein
MRLALSSLIYGGRLATSTSYFISISQLTDLAGFISLAALRDAPLPSFPGVLGRFAFFHSLLSAYLDGAVAFYRLYGRLPPFSFLFFVLVVFFNEKYAFIPKKGRSQSCSVHSEVKVGVARVGLNALYLLIILWPGGGATNEHGHPERAIRPGIIDC